MDLKRSILLLWKIPKRPVQVFFWSSSNRPAKYVCTTQRCANKLAKQAKQMFGSFWSKYWRTPTPLTWTGLTDGKEQVTTCSVASLLQTALILQGDGRRPDAGNNLVHPERMKGPTLNRVKTKKQQQQQQRQGRQRRQCIQQGGGTVQFHSVLFATLFFK